jgi:hypothetical protein
MKKVAIIGLLIVVLTLGLALPAQAAVTQNIKQPTTMVVVIPCNGDVVILEGDMHILMTFTLDGNGGVHVKSHFQPQNLKGTSEAGNSYIGAGVTQDNLNTKVGETSTYINNYRMIGKGQAPNFMVHETWHITINANGEVTAEVDNVKTTCE